MSESAVSAGEFVLFRAEAEILGVFSTAKALFFPSFLWASKRKKNGFLNRMVFQILVIGSTFFLEKKVAKKTSAVIKMPNPRSQIGLLKTILYLEETLNLTFTESRFPQIMSANSGFTGVFIKAENTKTGFRRAG